MFLSYSDFVNEKLNQYSLYLACKESFLLELLQGEVEGKKYIILTEDPTIDHNDIRIEFDRALIKEQGGICIIREYDWEFWESHHEAIIQVTGYKNSEDYYKKNNWVNADDAIADGGLSWSQFLQKFAIEAKFGIKRIEIEDGLILSIESKVNLKDETRKLIDKYKIELK